MPATIVGRPLGADHHPNAGRVVAELLGDRPRFVHFTSRGDADAIVASGQLELSTVVANAVYAVAVGGEDIPGVQQGTGSRRGFGAVAGERDHAVLFSSAELPDTVFPEEVIWHRATPLPVTDCTVLSRAAARVLLDASLAIPEP